MTKLYIDMDGTLVDFKSAFPKTDPNTLAQHEGKEDEVEGIFALMDPMPGAIEAVNILKEKYDCRILSTAPWRNPSAWSDKLRWVQEHFGSTFEKKLILTHDKGLLNDDKSYLIDDRLKHGADCFGSHLIRFDSDNPDWEGVTRRLLDLSEADEEEVIPEDEGPYYRHFKGRLYKRLYIATDALTLEKTVVYQALYGEHGIWTRSAEVFFSMVEKDGVPVRRFAPVEFQDISGEIPDIIANSGL